MRLAIGCLAVAVMGLSLTVRSAETDKAYYVGSATIDLPRNDGSVESIPLRMLSRKRWTPDEAKHIVDALLKMLQDGRHINQPDAFNALRHMIGVYGNQATEVPKILVPLLADPWDRTRKVEILKTLGTLDDQAESVTPVLRKVFDDEDRVFIKLWACAALARVDAQNPVWLEKLRTWLKAEGPVLRYTAARALAFVGPKAKAATEDLRSAQDDTDPGVRIFASYAIWKVTGNPEAALPVLRRAILEKAKPLSLTPWEFSSSYVPHNAYAAGMLGGMTSAADSVVPILHEAQQSEDAVVSSVASSALMMVEAARANASDLKTMPRENEQTRQ